MLEYEEIRVVVPSRKRADQIATALALWPQDRVSVFVDEDEEADYAFLRDEGFEVRTHGSVKGMAHLCNMILDEYDERCVVKCDDDVECMTANTGRKIRKFSDPESCFQVVWNIANICDDLGIMLGSLSGNYDVRKVDPMDPFGPARFDGCISVHVGRTMRYDDRLGTHSDLDMYLQALLRERIVWVDGRFSSLHGYVSAGGVSPFRTIDRQKADWRLLKSKWGDWVSGKHGRQTLKTGARVKRRQNLSRGSWV